MIKLANWLQDISEHVPQPLGRRLYRLSYRINDWYYEVRNRLFAKYYLIDVKAMPRGAWWDTDRKMFHAMFQLLVDYVENECSSMALMDEDDPVVVAYQKASWWDRWRNRKAWASRLGKAHLHWAASLDATDEVPNRQAQNARDALALYLWYTETYPNRPDPFDAFDKPEFPFLAEDGTPTETAFGSESRDGFFKMNRLTDEMHEYYKRVDDLEAAYTTIDTGQMKKLVEIRHGLWT